MSAKRPTKADIVGFSATAEPREEPPNPAKRPEPPLALSPVPADLPPPAEPPPPAPEPVPADPMQMSLLDVPPDWKATWRGMPDFEQRDESPWQTVPVHFRNRADRVAFSKLLGQTITDDTRSLWYPKAEIRRYVDKRYATEGAVNPRHPVYVISKGRWEKRLTADSLARIGVPFSIVVEPQEADNYRGSMDPAKVLVLPFSNLGQGSIPARNWVWEHAVASGADRHWILDDNIDGFYRLNDNLKVPCETGATFKAIEDFVDRYENVGIAGMQYFMFASRKTVIPPFALNTRIYSCILINHALQGRPDRPERPLSERWRGRYNEDTDLSIRALKAGWATVLFNAFLAYKITTMTMTGGNTEALYKIEQEGKDGRRLMAESLKTQHPELVEVVCKWDRWQHSVDYTPFRDNRLRPKPGVEVADEPNNYGMKFEQLSDEEMAARDST